MVIFCVSGLWKPVNPKAYAKVPKADLGCTPDSMPRSREDERDEPDRARAGDCSWIVEH
ncbi:hypothetical protein AMATHDRAFT_61734 [Amanita thiersii Skay4041]|uniref:Uncharacterized protein n=1 Tax=Amanita thiersii Skay4041 TaxID=703135 RepID=A0A2A9NQQ9_9AGAR|nr:hypothetical protein AMATHDRAFT_61734 [Amanita thiersii Skay4041]